MVAFTVGKVRNWPAPLATAINRKNSKIPCPRTISGPAQNPRRADSLMVTVRTGPGATAPENPIKNEVIKIPPIEFMR